MEDILSDTNSSIKVLQEEKSQEISTLKSQVATQVARVEENKKQMSVLENTRIDHKSAHAVKWLSISEKYDNTRLELTSQLKLLSECFLIPSIFLKITTQRLYYMYICIFIFLNIYPHNPRSQIFFNVLRC